jgi:hypothetical protein
VKVSDDRRKRRTREVTCDRPHTSLRGKSTSSRAIHPIPPQGFAAKPLSSRYRNRTSLGRQGGLGSRFADVELATYDEGHKERSDRLRSADRGAEEREGAGGLFGRHEVLNRVQWSTCIEWRSLACGGGKGCCRCDSPCCSGGRG